MGRLSLVGIPRTGPRGALNIVIATLAVLSGTTSPPAAPSAGQYGSVSVVVRGSASAGPPLRVSSDTAICGDTVPDETVVTSRGLVSNAVVIMPGLAGTHPPAVEIANEKCRFVPHAAIAAPGASLRMVSHDAALHTVHANHHGRSLFNVGLPVPHAAVTRAARVDGPVMLRCNTHPWMSGFVYLTSARAVLTGAEGRADFADVPPGTHRIEVWHEALGTVSGTVTVNAASAAAIALTLTGK